MQVTNNYNQPNFCAIKIYPKVEEWSPKILGEVLQSKTIIGLAEADAKKGLDTRISYQSFSHLLLGHSGYESKTCQLRVESSKRNIFLVSKGSYSLKKSCRTFIERARVNKALLTKIQRLDSLFFPADKKLNLQKALRNLEARGISVVTDDTPLGGVQGFWAQIKSYLSF